MFETAYQHSKNIQERINRLRIGETESESIDNSSGDNNNEEKSSNTPEPSPTQPVSFIEENENEKLKMIGLIY